MSPAGSPIAVAVNLLWCVPGEVGGSEEYLTRQIAGLAEVDAEGVAVAPTLFALDSYAGAHRALAQRYRTVSPPVSGQRRSMRVLAEHTWLAAHTRRSRYHLVHHGGGTVPSVGGRPVLLTIHDLQYLSFPEYFSPTKLRYLRAVMPRSVDRASVIATPTEFVRSTVIEAFGLPDDRVMVVPHGVPSNPPAPALDEAALRDRYALGDGPLLVYPAITHPHKNHRVLLEALARHWTDPELRLVLLGGRGAADEMVTLLIDELGVGDRVVRPGRVPDHVRDAFVSAAEALVFPSRYEGFGAPVIEAMAVGTPVICSDHEALREVAGHAAVVVADDAEAWGAALATVSERRAELVAAGHARLERFTAAVSAAALIDAYRRTVA